MSRQVSPSRNRSYGVLQVTRVWRASRATLYRQRRCDRLPRRRPGPLGPMPDAALVAAIRDLLAESPLPRRGLSQGLGTPALRQHPHRQAGRAALDARARLLAPRRVGLPHGPKAHDGTIRTERVDQMWGTDLTSTLTGEGQASIVVTVDHDSTECLGIHAARRATRFEALEPLRQGVCAPASAPSPRGSRAA